MIESKGYVGPMTKSAQAMMARAERRSQRAAERAKTANRRVTPVTSIRRTVHEFGLTMTILLEWEEAQLIVFQRQRGARVVDAAARERLSMLLRLRRLGLKIADIADACGAVPPTPESLRRMLQEQQSIRETGAIVGIGDLDHLSRAA